MKRFVAILFSFVAVVGLCVCFSSKPNYYEDYLRIHIRANSNSEIDQDIKYQIKDKIVEFLTPVIADCKTKNEFVKTLNKNLFNITRIADEILAQNNFDYKSSAAIRNEYFPVRSYEDLTLDCGYYDALIVELGEAQGDNWWCVVYPPLCFLNTSSNYIYRSRILETIKQFFGG